MKCNLFIIIFLGVLSINGNAQNNEPLVLSGMQSKEKFTITWIPSHDSIWALSKKSGFTVVRKNAKNENKILITGLKPKSKSWFETNQSKDNGFIGVIGHFVHSDEFKKSLQVDEHSNNAIQYNYLMPEAIRDPEIASILGLSVDDTDFKKGEKYTYEVSFNDTLGRKFQSSFTITLDGDGSNHNLEGFLDMPFTPEGGKTLFQLRPDLPNINLISASAKAYGDSVVIRWAPNNHSFWARIKNEPFAIMKLIKTVKGDSTYTEYVLLDTISHWKLNQFTPELIQKDSMILIAAQSIYGKQKSTPKDGFILQSMESEMSYGLAMLAADRSSMAADALGLRFVDKNVKPNELLSYAIVSRGAQNVIESGFVDIQNTIEIMNPIIDFSAIQNDRKIELRWNKANSNIYSSYILEKSEDGGKTFQMLTKSPLLTLENEHGKDDDFYHFNDSLYTNYQKIIYRIKGIDAFGDQSEATLITTYGVDKTPPNTPLIYQAVADEKGMILLRWEIANQENDLDKFHILVSNKIDGDYQKVAQDLPSNTRTFQYPGNIENNMSYYFILVAQDTAGNQQPSEPTFVQMIDSIAPAPPSNLMGLIDSTGIASIVWDQGLEKDLKGYKVYMSNNPKHEFSQITSDIISMNSWSDTIALKALDKNVFYKVVAVDNHNNHSAFSKILKLKRPDIIPPASPGALPASSDVNGVKLNWTISPSNDVVAYVIFRRMASSNDTVFGRIHRIQNKLATTWTDTTAIPEILYEYRIKAQDQSALLSEFSFPIKGRRSFDLAKLEIQYLDASYQKAYDANYLKWESDVNRNSMNNQPFNYFLYRKEESGSWKKITQLDSSYLSYLDRDIKSGIKYSYGIKMVLNDGKTGNMKESKVIVKN